MLRKILPLLALLLLTGCASSDAAPEQDSAVSAADASASAAEASPGTSPDASPGAVPEGRLTYSNLDSEASREEVARCMADAGIPSAAIDTVRAWIVDYNDCMRSCEAFTLAADFVEADGIAVDYGEYYPMSKCWYKDRQRDYQDILCRIAAFELLSHQIGTANLLPQSEWAYADPETAWLYSDWNILRGREATADEHAYRPNPLVDWDDAALARYFTFYAPITLPAERGREALAQAIQTEWQRRGVSFAPGKASLVTLWVCSDTQAAVGHAAVLLEDGDGLLLFEKTNPESPYSAARFRNVRQVKAYLIEMLRLDDARYGIEREEPLVMRNDTPL